DPALAASAPAGVTRFDLATEWKRHTGLPFVFACWAVRKGACDVRAVRARLEQAADRGLERIDELAEAESRRTFLAAPRLAAYLRILDYRLDERHERGMRAFLDE